MEGIDCQTCGMHVAHPSEYHPFIFCELYLLGHHDPAQYLKDALLSALVVLPERAGDPVSDHYTLTPV